MGLLVSLLLVGCNPAAGDPVYLPVLLADPMSEYEHPELQEVRRSLQAYDPSDFLGKPVQPRVLLEYVTADGNISPDMTADIVATAESAGWIFESSEPSAGIAGDTLWWTAQKEVELGTASLSIALRDQESKVSIRLGFVDVP